jgi:hypothetical protein
LSSRHRFFVGLDLGQASDYTALNIQAQIWNAEKKRNEYEMRYLDRVRGMPYPDVVAKVSTIMESDKLNGSEPAQLILDKTGVGAPVADMFKIGPIKPIEITITGGLTASNVPGGFHVPKRDLVFALLAVFQSGRFKIAEGLALATPLMEELTNFKVKINSNGHDSYAAWRETQHDDLVLSAAMATWYGERFKEPVGPLRFGGVTRAAPWKTGGGDNWVAQMSADMIRSHSPVKKPAWK